MFVSFVATLGMLFGAMQRLGSLGARVMSPRSEWMRLPAFTGWGLSKDLLRPATRTFRERWDGLAAEASVAPTAAQIEISKVPQQEPERTADPSAQLAHELAALGATVETVQSGSDIRLRPVSQSRHPTRSPGTASRSASELKAAGVNW
jgi:hypothetical protein